MKGLTWKTFKVDTVLAVNHLVQGLVRAGAEPTIRDDFNE